MMGITLEVSFKEKKTPKITIVFQKYNLNNWQSLIREENCPYSILHQLYRNSCMHLIYSTFTLVGES